MPKNTRKVDRTTCWGNPFRPGENDINDASEATARFREALFASALPFSVAELIADLGGWNLACWCKQGAPCHADVLLQVANPEKAM